MILVMMELQTKDVVLNKSRALEAKSIALPRPPLVSGSAIATPVLSDELITMEISSHVCI